jgi:nucleotide-binding universal stress UspA family protein
MIRTVLAPVDFSESSPPELSLAVEVVQAFAAQLVLHHNLESAPMGLSRAWDWDETHRKTRGSNVATEERIRGFLDRLPEGVKAQAHVSRGLVLPVLLHLIRELAVDLVVLASHGRTNDHHTSVGERIIRQAPCPVLAFHHNGGEGQVSPSLGALVPQERREVLVPIDFSAASAVVASYAFELARRLPVRLRLLHVHSPTAPRNEVAASLLAMVPEDLAGRAEAEIRTGAPEEEIVAAAGHADVAFVVMGEHARDLLHSLFTRDTSREVLHGSPRPVWFVPAGYRHRSRSADRSSVAAAPAAGSSAPLPAR